jgi:hypothetical protein
LFPITALLVMSPVPMSSLKDESNDFRTVK